MVATTNQGLILPDGADNANVPLSFSELVDGSGAASLENRLVQRYLSIADRTARNPAPIEGEISYLSDLNRYEGYTGSAWIPLYPLTTANFLATNFAVTSVTYTTAGVAVLGVTIQVPLTGQVEILYSAFIDNATAVNTFVSPQLNTGAVIGAGATLSAPSDSVAVTSASLDGVSVMNFITISGLTPGTDVNAFLTHRTTSGSNTVGTRRIQLRQA